MKKNRFLWYLYDFSNSIALVGLLYYFSLWVVVERGGSQWLVSLPVSFATLALLLIMPRIARGVDMRGHHKQYMILFSVCAAASLLVMSLIGSHIAFGWIFLIYFLFNLFFQAGYIFSSSLLHTVSDEHNRAKISGQGQAWGQIGNLVGVMLSFLTISHFMVAKSDKLNVFFWSAIIFLLLLIPISRFKVPGKKEQRSEDPEVLAHLPNLAAEVSIDTSLIQKLKAQPRVTRFLIAYALYSDAVVTLTLFIALYLKKVVNWEDGQIRIASVLVLVGSIIGGLLVSLFVKKGKELKVVSKSLIIWPLIILLFAMTSQMMLMYVLIALIGFLMSFIFAVSRAYYTLITPLDQQAEYFSVYVIFERIGAIFGPILWSAVVSLCLVSGLSELLAYRVAIVSVALITGVGYFILKKLHIEEEIKEKGGVVTYLQESE